MNIEIRIPDLGNLFTTAKVSRWLKETGDVVEGDEPILILETEVYMVEMPSPEDGILTEMLVNEGDTVEVGALLGYLQPHPDR